MKRTALPGTILAVLFFAFPVFAQQMIMTPYWCGTYWSSTPCTNGGYGNNYYNYQYPQYSYYTFPNQYYPSNYNYYYPYYSYQYYYPQPSCSITYSYTNNPNYFGGMYQQAIQLSWSSNYASSAYISGVGSVSRSGIRVVYPYGYGQYVMTVYGPGGQNTCTTYYQQPQYYQQQVPPNYWNQYNYNYGYNYGNQYAW